MAKERDKIRMSDAEVAEFLDGRHTMSVATIGKDGRPHLVAMWYGFLDGKPAFWTYSKSQKIRNLERDDRITCMVEDGDTYDQLRGISLVGRGTVLRDEDSRMKIAESLFERYTGPVNEAARIALRKRGEKRVVVQIVVEKVISWDHRKLGST